MLPGPLRGNLLGPRPDDRDELDLPVRFPARRQRDITEGAGDAGRELREDDEVRLGDPSTREDAMSIGQPLQPIAARRVSAVDLVLHEIRQSILSGVLAPGEPFVVQSLTEKLGVSHVPVREALRQLEAQGLITLSPSRSAVVAALDSEDLHGVYRLRQWIEPELAALSAGQRSDADLERLSALLDGMFSEPMTEGQWDLHRDFHQLLVQPAAGEWDLRILSGLWYASERFTRLLLDHVAMGDDSVRHRRGAHADLLDAARDRDATRLRDAVRGHLAENERNAAARLQAIGKTR